MSNSNPKANLVTTNLVDEMKHIVDKLDNELQQIDEKEKESNKSSHLGEAKSKSEPKQAARRSKSVKKYKKKSSKGKKSHKRSKYTSSSSHSSPRDSDIENYESSFSSPSSLSTSPSDSESAENEMNKTPNRAETVPMKAKLEEGEINEAKQHHKKKSKKRKIHHRHQHKSVKQHDSDNEDVKETKGGSIEADDKHRQMTNDANNKSSGSMIDYEDFYCEYDLDESLMDTINSSTCNEKSKANETNSSFASPVVQRPLVIATVQQATPITSSSIPSTTQTPIIKTSNQMGLLPLPQTPQIKPQMSHQFNRSLQANRSQTLSNNSNNNKMNRSLNRSFSNGNSKPNLNSSLERYHKIMKIGSTSNSPALNSSLPHLDAQPFYTNPSPYSMPSAINSNQFEQNNTFNQFNPMMNSSFMNYQGPTPPPPPMTPDLANPHIPFSNEFSSPMFNSPMFNNKPNFQRLTTNSNFAMNKGHVMTKTPNLQHAYPSNYSMNQPPKIGRAHV